MFGYVSVYKPELRIREWNTFRCYYCGLCKTIGREFSQVSRFLLNYDCTFLYVLGAAFCEAAPRFSSERCPRSPLWKKTYAIDAGADYAASVNVMLAVENLRDDVRDGFSPLSAAGAAVLGGAGRRCAARYPDVYRDITTNLAALAEAERSGTSDMDAAADPFAKLLGSVFSGIEGAPGDAIRSLGYNLGRWIYLIDAADDMEKDAKSGSYNPCAARYGKKAVTDDPAGVRDEMRFGLTASLRAAISAYDSLEIKKNKGILDNIMHLGLQKRTDEVLSGKKKGK